jgi:hypothetical protein
MDLEIKVPFQNQESRFSSKTKDPDWEVTYPLGGIGSLYYVVLELIDLCL